MLRSSIFSSFLFFHAARLSGQHSRQPLTLKRHLLHPSLREGAGAGQRFGTGGTTGRRGCPCALAFFATEPPCFCGRFCGVSQSACAFCFAIPSPFFFASLFCGRVCGGLPSVKAACASIASACFFAFFFSCAAFLAASFLSSLSSASLVMMRSSLSVAAFYYYCCFYRWCCCY